MTINDEELVTGEVRIAIDSRGIFDDVNKGIRAWRESDTKEILSEVGAKEHSDAKGGSISSVTVEVGNNYIHKKDDKVQMVFSAFLSKDGLVTSQPEKGYIDNEARNKLIAELEEQGFTDITPTGEEESYSRGITMSFGKQKFELKLGAESLEKDIERWKTGGQYGSQPDKNGYHILKLVQDQASVTEPTDLNEDEFALSCIALSGATQRTIWALDRFYDVGKTTVNLDLKPFSKKETEQRQKLGYSITSYDDGEFEFNGMKGEPIYSKFDSVQWKNEQSHIVEFRALGNRQILTMNKDSLVFGRWGGLKASQDGNQADVLIDEDVDRETHKIVRELGVSRRHFTISIDNKVNESLSARTGGLVNDVVVLEDLFPKNATCVFRGSDISSTIFERVTMVDGGEKAIVLPGDVIVVGGGTKIDRGEDWINQKDRGIGLVYLGERKFVKVVLGEGGGDTAVLADILEITDPDFVAHLTSGGGMLTDTLDSILAGKIEPEDPAVVKALLVVEAKHRELESKEIMSDVVINEKSPDDLIHLLGNVDAPENVTLENALSIAKLRNEPLVASYATLTALRVGGVEEVKQLFISREFWKKLSPDAVLVCLDHIEKSTEMEASVKKDFISIAFSSRDDEVRVFIRERYKKYDKKNNSSM